MMVTFHSQSLNRVEELTDSLMETYRATRLPVLIAFVSKESHQDEADQFVEILRFVRLAGTTNLTLSSP